MFVNIFVKIKAVPCNNVEIDFEKLFSMPNNSLKNAPYLFLELPRL